MYHGIWSYLDFGLLCVVGLYVLVRLTRYLFRWQRNFYVAQSVVLPLVFEAVRAGHFSIASSRKKEEITFSIFEQEIVNSQCRIIYFRRENGIETIYCELISGEQSLEMRFRNERLVFWKENNVQLTSKRPQDELLLVRSLYRNLRRTFNAE